MKTHVRILPSRLERVDAIGANVLQLGPAGF